MFSAPKPVSNPYDLHCLQPGAEMMIFRIFQKIWKINGNEENFKNENMEITENMIFTKF